MHERTERLERFLHGGKPVPFVQKKKIDMIGAQPFQAAFALMDDMVPRCALVVGAVADAQSRFGSDQNPLAAPLENLTQNRFRAAIAVHVGRIDKIDPTIDANVDHASSVLDVMSVSEGQRSHAQGRDLQSAAAEVSVFHSLSPVLPRHMSPRQTYLMSRNSWMPYLEPSRPSPDCLTPPNGARSFETIPVLTPTIPHCKASDTRQTRPMSRE